MHIKLERAWELISVVIQMKYTLWCFWECPIPPAEPGKHHFVFYGDFVTLSAELVIRNAGKKILITFVYMLFYLWNIAITLYKYMLSFAFSSYIRMYMPVPCKYIKITKTKTYTVSVWPVRMTKDKNLEPGLYYLYNTAIGI